jgi:uncharacterized damage-inducible protein DinB
MDLVTHFQMLARYNRIANERLFAACAQLEAGEYRQRRAAQVHVMLSQTSTPPPALDLHRIVNP